MSPAHLPHRFELAAPPWPIPCECTHRQRLERSNTAEPSELGQSTSAVSDAFRHRVPQKSDTRPVASRAAASEDEAGLGSECRQRRARRRRKARVRRRRRPSAHRASRAPVRAAALDAGEPPAFGRAARSNVLAAAVSTSPVDQDRVVGRRLAATPVERPATALDAATPSHRAARRRPAPPRRAPVDSSAVTLSAEPAPARRPSSRARQPTSRTLRPARSRSAWIACGRAPSAPA